jgi:uncharacterized protein DUF5335
MPTSEIPRNEWTAFCDRFSREHEGWLATVEVLDESIGAQIEAENLPLEGVSADLKKAGDETISIFLGDEPNGKVTHIVAAPTRLWVQKTGEGADQALEVEAPSGKTILRFRTAALPEMVDGIAAGGAG